MSSELRSFMQKKDNEIVFNKFDPRNKPQDYVENLLKERIDTIFDARFEIEKDLTRD